MPVDYSRWDDKIKTNNNQGQVAAPGFFELWVKLLQGNEQDFFSGKVQKEIKNVFSLSR